MQLPGSGAKASSNCSHSNLELLAQAASCGGLWTLEACANAARWSEDSLLHSVRYARLRRT